MKIRKLSVPAEVNEAEKVSIIKTNEVEIVLSIAKIKTTDEHGVSHHKEVGFYISDEYNEMMFSLSKENAIYLSRVINDITTAL